MQVRDGVFHGGPFPLVFAELPAGPPIERVGFAWICSADPETIRLCGGTELMPQTYHFVYELECVVDGVAHYFCVDCI